MWQVRKSFQRDRPRGPVVLAPTWTHLPQAQKVQVVAQLSGHRPGSNFPWPPEQSFQTSSALGRQPKGLFQACMAIGSLSAERTLPSVSIVGVASPSSIPTTWLAVFPGHALSVPCVSWIPATVAATLAVTGAATLPPLSALGPSLSRTGRLPGSPVPTSPESGGRPGGGD